VSEQKSLNNQLIIITETGQAEHPLAARIRVMRQAFLSEKNYLNWPSIYTYKTIEKIINTVGEVEGVTVVSMQDADPFDFLPGHPRERTVYAKHPVKKSTYFPLASFHRFTFEHKTAELITLLGALGASSITVEHLQGWGRDFAAKIEGQVGGTGDSLNAEASKTAKNSSHLLFTLTLAGHSSPAIPDGLVWFEHESLWKTIAENRIKHGLKDFTLVLSYTEDYGITAGLGAQLKKASLEIGGSFEEHQNTVWRLSGTFG
jgi:hypothetical protein